MIKGFTITNYKSIKDLDIELSKINVLLGLNGVGKSSFIQSFLLLHQSYLSGVLETMLILNNDKCICVGTAADVICEDRTGEFIEFSIKLDRKDSLRFHYPYDKDQKLAGYLEIANCENRGLYSYSDISLFDVKRFEYLAAERLAPTTIHKSSFYEISENNSIGKNGELCVHYLLMAIENNLSIGISEMCHQNSIKFDNDDIDNSRPKKNCDFLINVENWLGEISPGVKIKPELLIGSDFISLPVYFQRDDARSSNMFKLTNVGFGITYVLPVIIALLKTVPGDFLIIENPESHIHPRGQFKLGELIGIASRNNVQVIVETHSDHIIDGIKNTSNLDDLNILFFHRTKDELSATVTKIKADNINDPLLYSTFYSNYRTKIEKRLKNYTKPLVITEGKTDKSYVKTAWSKLYPSKEMPFDVIHAGLRLNETDDSGSADSLRRELEYLSMVVDLDKIVIGVFDNDQAGFNQFRGLNKKLFEIITDNIVKHKSKKIYAIILPIPQSRKEYIAELAQERFFTIEHYFSNHVLSKYGMIGKYILNTKLFSISGKKNNFASCINSLGRQSFSKFTILFDVLLGLLK